MARILTVLVVLALAAAGYLMFTRHEEPKQAKQEKTQPETAQAVKPDWRTYTFDDDAFSVELPASPQHAEESLKDPNTGRVRKYDMYVSSLNDGSLYMISMITYAEDEELQGKVLLEAVRDEMTKAHPGNKLNGSTNGTFLNNDSIDFSIVNPEAEMGSKAFLAGNRLFLLTHMAPKDQYEQKDFSRFADSFKLLKK